jgi:hypothetical protein
MRQILAVPYQTRSTGSFDFVGYPIGEKLGMECQHVTGNPAGIESFRGELFDKCKGASWQYKKRLAVAGDHLFAYPFLIDDDIEQLVVIDKHNDGACDRKADARLHCGSWAFHLTQRRPDLRYVGILGSREEDLLILQTREQYLPIVRPSSRKRYLEPSIGSIKKALDKSLKDRKTALSICADCCRSFESRWKDMDGGFMTPKYLQDVIRLVGDKTELSHIDLMEISLDDEGSIAAGKRVIETAMGL